MSNGHHDFIPIRYTQPITLGDMERIFMRYGDYSNRTNVLTNRFFRKSLIDR